VIDSHCHLADDTFAGDLADVVARAQAASLERSLVILEAGNTKEADQGSRLLELWPETRFAIGVHPHQAHQFKEARSQAAAIVREQFSRTPAARAIGEIGLDYHYDFSSPDMQREVFRGQLCLALSLDRPVVIHTREADDDTVAALREEGGGRLRGVFHCFTGNHQLAEAALELGFYISVAGILTFPKAEELRQVIRRVPLDRLLVETDSPFLAPVPYRGKRNEPAYVVEVAQVLAEARGVSLEEISRQTTENFFRLFSKVPA
jgi:TatD DNase family protein